MVHEDFSLSPLQVDLMESLGLPLGRPLAVLIVVVYFVLRGTKTVDSNAVCILREEEKQRNKKEQCSLFYIINM